MAVVGNMAQMIPEVLDNVDGDKMVNKLSKIYSIDPEILNGKEAVAGKREARAKAQEMEAKMQMLERTTQMGATMEGANKDGATAKNLGTK
jgi:hypothetical protein